MNIFSNTSVLITHFNRSKSLERLLKVLEDSKLMFGEIVVSDDGSQYEHLERLTFLQKTYSFKLIRVPTNQGLGHNINKGQDCIATKYTLYIQEDFVPTEHFLEALKTALTRMEFDNDLDIVRFWSYFSYPYLGKTEDDGFAQMLLKPWGMKYNKIYHYSDNPHLRRSDFFKKFGRYAEGLSGDETEYNMCLSFIRNKASGIFYVDSTRLFEHLNSLDEPSTMLRPDWSNSRKLAIRLSRAIYNQLRYNYDIFILKSKERI